MPAKVLKRTVTPKQPALKVKPISKKLLSASAATIQPVSLTPELTKTYVNLDKAYAILNEALFKNELSPCLITLQRKSSCNGYYSPDRFEHRSTEGSKISEIALNPENFKGRTDAEILSTLAHEMVHHWQECFGKPASGNYHNKEWCDKMIDIGLEPVGTPTKMSHTIVKHDLFDKEYTKLAALGIVLDWQSRGSMKKPSKNKNKTKFTCPSCEAAAWGKAELNIVCGDCDIQLIVAE